MEEAKQIGEALIHLEEKGVLTKSFKTPFRKRDEWKFKIEDFEYYDTEESSDDMPLDNYDYNEYKNSDLYKMLQETVAEGKGKEGFLCDTAIIETGSMALTAKGRAVIEYMSMGL